MLPNISNLVTIPVVVIGAYNPKPAFAKESLPIPICSNVSVSTKAVNVPPSGTSICESNDGISPFKLTESSTTISEL